MFYGKSIKQIGPIITIPSFLVAGPIVGFYIGNWCDHKFAIAPWGVTLLTLFGFAAGVQQAIVAFQCWSRNAAKDRT